MSNKGQTIKLVILGESGVGKSSLALRFVSNEFKPFSTSTIGASFMSKTITVENISMDLVNPDEANSETIPPATGTRKISFKIWDTAGQEKYRSLATMYYRGAGAALLVYDVTKASSFEVLQSWVNELKFKGPPDIVLGLCGNKCDLQDEMEREVDAEEALKFAKRLGCFHLETSAKDDVNVFKAFEEIAKRVPPEEEEIFDIEGSNRKIDLGLAKDETEGSCSNMC